MRIYTLLILTVSVIILFALINSAPTADASGIVCISDILYCELELEKL